MWKHRNTPQSEYQEELQDLIYFVSSRIQSIQSQMTERALELLALPSDQAAFVLDIGCGSGLSGELLDEEGHVWVGVDVAPSMLGG